MTDHPDGDHMHFRRMDDMTPADFEVLRHVHEENLERLPDLLLGLLDSLGGDEAYPVDRKTHSLQAATRALRDGRWARWSRSRGRREPRPARSPG